MSQENVELVRRAIDFFNRGEIDRALEDTDDDFEMDWSNSIGPLKGVYRGRRQVLELWASFWEAWQEVRWDPEEIIDVDETRVILVNHVRMRGKGSGVEVDATGVQLWTIGDGKGQSVKLYQSKEDALAATGPPGSGTPDDRGGG
jgi:ketosteroid isomerase-like protein